MSYFRGRNIVPFFVGFGTFFVLEKPIRSYILNLHNEYPAYFPKKVEYVPHCPLCKENNALGFCTPCLKIIREKMK